VVAQGPRKGFTERFYREFLRRGSTERVFKERFYIEFLQADAQGATALRLRHVQGAMACRGRRRGHLQGATASAELGPRDPRRRGKGRDRCAKHGCKRR
jgi:hypothetical protein